MKIYHVPHKFSVIFIVYIVNAPSKHSLCLFFYFDRLKVTIYKANFVQQWENGLLKLYPITCICYNQFRPILYAITHTLFFIRIAPFFLVWMTNHTHNHNVGEIILDVIVAEIFFLNDRNAHLRDEKKNEFTSSWYQFSWAKWAIGV